MLLSQLGSQRGHLLHCAYGEDNPRTSQKDGPEKEKTEGKPLIRFVFLFFHCNAAQPKLTLSRAGGSIKIPEDETVSSIKRV